MGDKIKSIYTKIQKAIRKNKVTAILFDIFTTLVMFAIAGGIGVFIALGRHAGSPENFANKYVDACIRQDWEQAYEYLEIKESEFVNLEAYGRMMEGNLLYGDFTGSETSITSKTSSAVYIKMTYHDTNASKDTAMNIKLKRQKQNVYLFFSTWKVNLESEIIKNLTISVPTGTDITFDSKNIDAYFVKTEDSKDIYVIDRFMVGEHDFGISNPYIDAYTVTEYIEASDDSYSVEIADFNLKVEDEAYVTDTTTKVIFGMYQDVLSQSGIENLQPYFPESEESVALLTSIYESMDASINQSNGATLMSLSVDSYTTYVFSYIYPEKVEVRVDFNCSYEAKTGRTMINGVQGTYTGSGSSSAKIIFVLSEGAWTIDEVELTCINYAPPEA